MRKVYVLFTTHVGTGESWITGIYTSYKKANEALKYFSANTTDVKREILTEILM